MRDIKPAFAHLDFDTVFPEYGEVTEEYGPIAIGGELSVTTLLRAYSRGIFPWTSEPQIMWWSPQPRMVLKIADFRFHKSLRKEIAKLLLAGRLEIRLDHKFDQVLQHCSQVKRVGQEDTWITPAMQIAYTKFHLAGYVHSIETWLDNQLLGGLYFINIGRVVYGESMFSLHPNCSKIALAALISLCRKNHIPIIDCQQETPHLAAQGAKPIARQEFLAILESNTHFETPYWDFAAKDWQYLHPTLQAVQCY